MGLRELQGVRGSRCLVWPPCAQPPPQVWICHPNSSHFISSLSGDQPCRFCPSDPKAQTLTLFPGPPGISSRSQRVPSPHLSTHPEHQGFPPALHLHPPHTPSLQTSPNWGSRSPGWGATDCQRCGMQDRTPSQTHSSPSWAPAARLQSVSAATVLPSAIYAFGDVLASCRPQLSQPRKNWRPAGDRLPRQPGPRVPQVRPVQAPHAHLPTPPGAGSRKGEPRKGG